MSLDANFRDFCASHRAFGPALTQRAAMHLIATYGYGYAALLRISFTG